MMGNENADKNSRSQVWQEEQVLLDGHNRYALCTKHGLSYDTATTSLPDLDAAKAWMLKHQLGRRNLTPEQMSYLRGKQYEQVKQIQGTNNQHTQPTSENRRRGDFQTSKKLAEQHKVGARTIQRDAAFSRSVDTVAEAVGPEARQTILARDTKVARQDMQKLADIATSNPQTAQHVVEQVKQAPTPKAAKQIIHQAAKAIPPKPTLALQHEEAQPKRGRPVVVLRVRQFGMKHHASSRHL